VQQVRPLLQQVNRWAVAAFTVSLCSNVWASVATK
jgi:hypothetical protein